MPAETKAANDPNRKKKQILVIVLLAGLLIAILTQPGKNDEAVQNIEITLASHAAPTNVTDPAAHNADAVSSQTVEPTEDPRDRLAEVCELSRIDLADITKLELFAPEPARRPEKMPKDMPRVQAIYGTSSGHAALLGDSIVRGGQPLPQGGQVLDVTRDGIQIAR